MSELQRKTCVDCSENKTHDHFYRRKSGSIYNRCKSCHYAYTQRWRANNREKLRELDRTRYRERYRAKILARKRFQKYGITQDQYESMLAAQGNVCPICLNGFSDSGRSGDWFIPAVDHDHEPGIVRGILHRRCNLAIEFLLTDEELTEFDELIKIPGMLDAVATTMMMESFRRRGMIPPKEADQNSA